MARYLDRVIDEAHDRLSCENGWIDDMDRLTGTEGRDLIEDVGELDFVFFARDVT